MKQGYIYYCSNGNGRIKIGFSANHPDKRIEAGRTWCLEIQLMAFERGTKKTERARHTQFRDEHIDREWFALTPRLEQFIKNIPFTEEELFHALASR